METRHIGLSMIRVREETRKLIKQLAAKQDQTTPDFVAWAMEQIARDFDEEIPESYKTERVMDSQLAKGRFEKITQKQPKDSHNEHPTREQWDKMWEDGSAVAWMAEYQKRTGRHFPGYEMAFENSSRT